MGTFYKNKILWILAGAVSIAGILGWFTLFPSPHVLKYELTEGFNGWVLIQYGDARRPELPVTGEALILSISASGCLCTATPIPEGFRRNVFERIASDGRRTAIKSEYGDPISEIWEQVTTRESFAREIFSVGTKNEYAEAPKLPQIQKQKCSEFK